MASLERRLGSHPSNVENRGSAQAFGKPRTIPTDETALQKVYLLTFAHQIVVSPAVSCQNSLLIVKPVAQINIPALKSVLHLISSKRDVQGIDYGRYLFKNA